MIAFLLAAQLAATAVPAPPAAAISRPSGEKSEDAQVCRSEVSTGHRIAGYICHTRGEWARIEANTRVGIDRQESRNQANCLRGVSC